MNSKFLLNLCHMLFLKKRFYIVKIFVGFVGIIILKIGFKERVKKKNKKKKIKQGNDVTKKRKKLKY